MFGALVFLTDGDGPLQHGFGVRELVQRLTGLGDVGQRWDQVKKLRSELLFHDGQFAPEVGFRRNKLHLRKTNAAKLVQIFRKIGMEFAEETLFQGQVPLHQRLRFGVLALRPVYLGQISQRIHQFGII